MITFNKSDFDTILEYAKKNLPEEACGLIGGTIENGYTFCFRTHTILQFAIS